MGRCLLLLTCKRLSGPRRESQLMLFGWRGAKKDTQTIFTLVLVLPDVAWPWIYRDLGSGLWQMDQQRPLDL